MSYDAGWPGPAGPPPGNPPSGYPPPGYQGYPPPGYQGYPPPGYQGYPPPGYQGYPPPGYQGYPPSPPIPPALKPGVIPLRPLRLGDIFNGAVAYIRANPQTTLGLTTVVVVAAQIVSVILQIGPLALTGQLGALGADEQSTAALFGTSASSFAGVIATALATIVLNGMLTVVVGRAVFGASITIGEAWERVRGRLLALIGFTALYSLGVLVLVAVVAAVIFALMYGAGPAPAFVIGAPLVLGLLALLLYLGTMLAFAPPLIVLERLGVFAAIERSFALVKRDFWRVLGIWLLAQIVAAFIAGAVSVPFSVAGELLAAASESAVGALFAIVLLTIGNAIGQIITVPFTAGVVVLLYADRRIRAEAFDLVLQTGASRGGADAPADSTDHLWLTRQP